MKSRSSKSREIMNEIIEKQCDFEFYYQNVHGSLCPLGPNGGYSLCFGNHGDKAQRFSTLTEAFSTPFFPEGHSLEDIADELEIELL